MKTNNIALMMLALGLIVLVPPKTSSAARAFPGAEGFGANTRGAYELYEQTGNHLDLPHIIHVTNLNDSGTGSFRAAVTASGPRIVVFDIGGIITINSKVDVTAPYLTIAGQTAPGDGICIRGSSLRVIKSTHDIIVRGLRIRPTSIGTIGSSPIDGRDAVTIGNDHNDTGDPPSTDMIFDHNSFSWSTDEMFTMWAGVERVTLSNNILYQPSDFRGHQYGVLIGAGSFNISYHHNVLAHSSYRNPLIGADNDKGIPKAPSKVEVINNVVYNGRRWGGLGIFRNRLYTGSGDQPQDIVLRGNLDKAGNDTNTDGSNYVNTAQSSDQVSSGDYVEDSSKLYFHANLSPRRTLLSQGEWEICSSNTCNTAARYDSWPFASSGITETDPITNYNNLLGMDEDIPRIGAYPRDIVDTIALEEVGSGTDFYGTSGSWGTGPTSASTTSSWRNNRSMFPAYASGTLRTDSDRDGMPDSWESKLGLNPNDATDAHADRDSDGYFNIEEYINSFLSLALSDPPQLASPAGFKIE